jgi:hypothetical protein
MTNNASIPTVDPVELKELCKTASLGHTDEETALALLRRRLLIMALVERGFLKHDEVSDKLFRVAATILPYTQEDLNEATTLLAFRSDPERFPREYVDRVKQDALEHGVDLEHPKILDRLMGLITS